MFFAGQAVNEFFDHGYATSVDWIEVGGRVTEQVRSDFQIVNFRSAVERAPILHGARVHKILKTPQGDQNKQHRHNPRPDAQTLIILDGIIQNCFEIFARGTSVAGFQGDIRRSG